MKKFILKFMRKYKFLTALIVILILLTPFFIYQNESLTVTNYVYESEYVSPGLDGYRIVQLSDIHNKTFNNRLINKVKALEPNMIALTGDLIDDKIKDMEKLRDFMSSITEIAPVYFASGNNEFTSGKYEELKVMLTEVGIAVIEDEAITIVHVNSSFNLIGLRDPAFIDGLSTMPMEYTLNAMQTTISNLTTDGLDIMLAHRPSIISTYAAGGAELVLTGHAHGGQVRLPFIGGLISPDEGLFPEYTEGLYSLNNTTMIISRGLGNSVIPLRIFNRPEIVVVSLKSS